MKVSEKKQKQIDNFLTTPIKVGDMVYVRESLCYYVSDKTKKERNILVKVIEIKENSIFVVKNVTLSSSREFEIFKEEILGRYGVIEIGANPFNERGGDIRPIAFSLDSIIYNFELIKGESKIRNTYEFDGVLCKELNWNPFVYTKDGKKLYYQRDFCWTLAEKQALIDSIYNSIGLGTIIVRKRSWNSIEKMRANGETELAFFDIVDGKQRLNTIREFINNEFTDSYGNLFSDLSTSAQNKLTNNQLLQYGEMSEKTTDEDVLYQFLKVNFSGVPQSKEHINYIKSILNKF